MVFLVKLFATLCVVCASNAIADCAPGSANCQEQDAYATNMLQVGLSHKKKVDRKSWLGIHPVQNGPRAKPGAWCCDVYLGPKKVASERKVLQEYTREMITVIPVTGTKVVVNETHVFLPSKDIIRGTFERSTHVYGQYEYGTLEMKTYENPESMFPNVAAGSQEKWKVLHREGRYSTSSLDKINRIKEKRTPMDNMIAKQMNYLRIFLLNWVVFRGHTVEQAKGAGFDANHLDRVKDFTRVNNEQPTAFLQERKNQLVQNMSRHKSFAGKEPLSVYVGCQHFPARPDVQANRDGVYLPLNKMMVGLGAAASFSPLAHTDFAGGVTIISYDESTKEITIHFSAATLFFLFPDPIEDASSEFYFSPVNGQSFDNGVVPEEGRVQPIVPETKAGAIWDLVQSLPIDYTYLDQNEADLCPPARFEKLKRDAALLDFRDPTGVKNGGFNILEFAAHLVEVTDCGLSYLQAHPASSHGMGILEISAWSHFLMESPPTHRLDNAAGWDPV